MINEMLAAGMLFLGTVDEIPNNMIYVEYMIGNTIHTMDVPKETSVCEPEEGEFVLFYRDGIVKCFSKREI